MRRIYWDSVVFIRYFNKERDYIKILDSILNEVELSDELIIVTSVLTKVEVAFVAQEAQEKKLSDATEEQFDLFWNDDSVIEFIEFHDIIATQARKLVRQTMDPTLKNISPADAIHVASALWVKADEVHTYDTGWFGYNEITGLTITEPHTDNPLLL